VVHLRADAADALQPGHETDHLEDLVRGHTHPEWEYVASRKRRALRLREAGDVLRIVEFAVAVEGDVAAAECTDAC
jgi:hypothetical protein